VALCVQTALPLLHAPQLDVAAGAHQGTGGVAADGEPDVHSVGRDATRATHHDAEQCALCQAIQQGKRTVAGPGSIGPARSAIRRTVIVLNNSPATSPVLRNAAPRGPPHDA